jgi:hypothetical protein
MSTKKVPFGGRGSVAKKFVAEAIRRPGNPDIAAMLELFRVPNNSTSLMGGSAHPRYLGLFEGDPRGDNKELLSQEIVNSTLASYNSTTGSASPRIDTGPDPDARIALQEMADAGYVELGNAAIDNDSRFSGNVLMTNKLYALLIGFGARDEKVIKIAKGIKKSRPILGGKATAAPAVSVTPATPA